MEPLATLISKRGVRVRLTHERWSHIVESHDYLAGHLDLFVETVSDPDCVVTGVKDELLAVKRYDETAIGAKHVVVAYKEQGQDRFIITAFMTSKIDKLLKRGIQWQKS
ncbi:MAG TPA: hypothetical protein VN647_10160 [Nitrospira sp.]|nr:hypothetical protein [Nitrospira sp.]